MSSLTASEQESTTVAPCSNHDRRVAIVLLNYHGLDDTRKCLPTVDAIRQSWQNLRVILVDNDSRDEDSRDNDAAAIEREFPWVEVVRSPENLGWAGGNNLGLRHLADDPVDYVLLLNNDTLAHPSLIERLVAEMEASPQYGVVGVSAYYMDEPDVVMTDGCILYDPDRGFFARQEMPADRTGPGPILETELVNGCCMMIRRSLLDEIGPIDDRFFLIHEESEFCLRARRAGSLCGVLPEQLVWHKGSSTFQRESKPLQRYFDARNLALIARKHGGSSVFPGSGLQRWRRYLRHAYFMYADCLQQGKPQAAQAVLNGVSDGLMGYYGPLVERRRPLAAALGALFALRRRLSGG